jgi:hypothetical protein
MANGDVYTAISHLQQASLLYERSDEKEDEANVADVKFTLAALHFRNGDYRASIQLHGQALDVYSRFGGGAAVPLDEGIPQVQPAVTFMLDPIESDAEVLGNGQVGGAELHEPVTAEGAASDPLQAQHSTSSITKQRDHGSTGSGNRDGKEDPVLAMMNYWYAALANDTDGAGSHSDREEPDASRAQEAGKDEL